MKSKFENQNRTPREILVGVLFLVGCSSAPMTQAPPVASAIASSSFGDRDVASVARIPNAVSLSCRADGSATEITVDGTHFNLPTALSASQRTQLQATGLETRQRTSTTELLNEVDACLSKLERDGIKRFETMKTVDREHGFPTDARITSGEQWLADTKKNLTSRDTELADRALDAFRSVTYKCPELHKETKDRRSIRVTYPARGMNRGKNGDYLISELSQIIADALNLAVDPFLAMSIAILENPPVVNAGDGYRLGYGRIPVDPIAAYDMLGCLSPKSARRPTVATKSEIAEFRKLSREVESIDEKITQLETRRRPAIEIETARARREILWKATDDFLEKIRADSKRAEKAETEIRCFADPERCHAVMNENGQGLQLDLRYNENESGPVSRTSRVCSDKDTAAVEARPSFRPPSQNEGTCCADVKNSFLSEERVPYELLSWLGVRYVQIRIQSCVGRQTLESCIQKFNGEQCLGCTEKLTNDCYSGMVASDRPIYGARAADVMVNMLLANSEIQNLVAQTAKRLGRSVPSVFCLEKKGANSVSIEPARFLELQKKFVLGGEAENFTAAIQGQLRKPSSPAELHKYQELEHHRANVCRKYFE